MPPDVAQDRESHTQRLFDRYGVRSRAAIVAKWLTNCA
jgi:hypothetical protein